ncbi:MAG: DUF1016 N-terminal domain-containing protein [Heliobacteriaceae bacterium]|nr:DUF1016 N-terminal domain-containing protein [Heliobacteriaceae bacterium]
MLSRLSFSHFVELLRREDPFERLFYEMETIKNNWNVRELERAIDSALFIRTGLSLNKESVIVKIKNRKPLNTGNEYPKAVKFVRQTENVSVIRPEIHISKLSKNTVFRDRRKENRA